MIFRDLNWENYGLKIDGVSLTNLRFADDVTLIAKNAEELQEMLKQLVQKSDEYGLQINYGKTCILTNAEKTKITINQKKIEYADEVTYLGQLVSFKDQQNKELSKRIATGWRKYWALKHIFKNKKLSQFIKSKVFNICITPAITYGSQTWALTRKQYQRVQINQRRMERSMLGITLKDKIRNEDLRRKTKVKSIASVCCRLKWKWGGHVMRQGNFKWTTQITKWIPRQQKRRKGRPRRRWKDEFTEKAGTLYERAAQNKTFWKQLGEAQAQEWAL